MRTGLPEYTQSDHKRNSHLNLLNKIHVSAVCDIDIYKNRGKTMGYIYGVESEYVTWNVTISFYKKRTVVKYPFNYADKEFITKLWELFKNTEFAMKIFAHTYCEEHGEKHG